MWPWEHLAVGYLAYSALTRLRTGEPPDGPSAAAIVVGTQLPDVIDKPLAWTFAVYPGGYAVGHSIVVAIALSALAVGISRRIDRPSLGWAFAVGYVSHLPADVFYVYVTSGYFLPGIVLWPLVPAIPNGTESGLLATATRFFRNYVEAVASGRLLGLFLLELGLLLAALGAWIYDGLPGTVGLRRRLALTKRAR